MREDPSTEEKSGVPAKGAEGAGNETELEKVDMLLARLDASGLRQYVKLSENVPKIMLLNFMSGVARGLGFTVGTAIVLTVAYKLLSSIISMNIPYLTELLEDFVKLVGDIAMTRGR